MTVCQTVKALSESSDGFLHHLKGGEEVYTVSDGFVGLIGVAKVYDE